MPKKEQIINWPVIVFLVTTFLIAPVTWFINDHLDRFDRVQDHTGSRLRSMNTYAEETREKVIINTQKIVENDKDLEQVRERITRLEQRVYDVRR